LELDSMMDASLLCMLMMFMKLFNLHILYTAAC